MFPPLDPPVTTDEHYFTLDELRTEQDISAAYTDTVTDPNQDLAEEVIEHACGVAFIPRRRTETVAAAPNGSVYLTRPLIREIEAVNDGTDWTPERVALLEVYAGTLVGAHWTPGTYVTITYTHGYDNPPYRIRRAAMIATRVWTTRGPVDDRATQIAADGATVNLATPGLRGSVTGIPEVDAAIYQYDQRVLVG